MTYFKTDANGNRNLSSDPQYVRTLTASTTLDVTYGGDVINVGTDALVMTLPAVGATSAPAGMRLTFVNSGADGNNIITLAPNASDKFFGSYQVNGSLVTLTGTDDKDIVNTKATALNGDYIVIESDGSTGWRVVDVQGIWAEESVTFSYGKYTELTVATTLTADQSGTTFILNPATDGAAITLPAVTALTGFSARFIVGAAFATTDWTIVSTTNIIQGYASVNYATVLAANENTISFVASAETVGDYVDIFSDGTNIYVTGMGNSVGSITFTAP